MRQTKFRNLTAVFYCAVRNIFLLRTVVCAVLLPCCGANIVVWAYRCYVCRPAAHAICFTAGYGLAISRTCGVIKKTICRNTSELLSLWRQKKWYGETVANRNMAVPSKNKSVDL